MLSNPIHFFNNMVNRELIAPLFTGVNLIPGVIKTIGTIVGAAATGHKMFYRADTGRAVLFINQISIGRRKITKGSNKGTNRILDYFTINLKPPVWNIRVKTTIAQRISQVNNRPFSLTYAYTVNPIFMNQIWEKGGKAKTAINICLMDPNGKTTSVGSYTLNENKAEKNDSDQTINKTFSNAKGKFFVANLDAKSVTRTFEYSIKLSEA